MTQYQMFRVGRHLCYICSMNRNTVIAMIKQHEADLHAFGVVSVSVSGSTARDEGCRCLAP